MIVFVPSSRKYERDTNKENRAIYSTLSSTKLPTHSFIIHIVAHTTIAPYSSIKKRPTTTKKINYIVKEQEEKASLP